MIGTMLNVCGILLGGLFGLTVPKGLSAGAESQLRVMLGALTVFFGLRLTWLNLNGSFLQLLGQGLVLILALTLGKLTGRLLRLQILSNRLGRRAQENMLSAQRTGSRRVSDGFKPCTALFCAAPLGLIGSLVEGISLSHYFYPLAVKAVMEGFAAVGLARVLGWGVLLSALPVFAVQGTLTLVCARILQPFLTTHGLVASLNTVGGVLVFCVALVMLGLKRIELTDYLPSLFFAPLLTWVLKL